MADFAHLALVLLLITASSALAMIYARHLREISRGRRRRVFLPPPDVARQLIEHHREAKKAAGEVQRSTQLPPLGVPASEQRLCLQCGTSNLREAATCRKCGQPLGAVERGGVRGSAARDAAQRVSHGPVYAVLLTIILVSIGAILYQAWRLGGTGDW